MVYDFKGFVVRQVLYFLLFSKDLTSVIVNCFILSNLETIKVPKDLT